MEWKPCCWWGVSTIIQLLYTWYLIPRETVRFLFTRGSFVCVITCDCFLCINSECITDILCIPVASQHRYSKPSIDHLSVVQPYKPYLFCLGVHRVAQTGHVLWLGSHQDTWEFTCRLVSYFTQHRLLEQMNE